MKLTFGRTAGLDDAKAFLAQALSGNRFPHALLIHGPEGAGQNALLLDLADILACSSAEMRPCGACPGCRARRGNMLDTLIYLIPIEKKPAEGDKESTPVDEIAAKAQELESDPYGFAVSAKAHVHITQIREMRARLAYAEAARRARVILLVSAETMLHEAANTLLKILEEPPSDTYFLLSCADKSALLPTIISRCTSLSARPLAPAEMAEAIAAKKEWWGETPSPRLIPFAEGSLGALLNLHRNGGDTLLEEAGRFLSAALGEGWQPFAAYVAGSEQCGDMESAGRLLQFVLRMVRAFHRLEAVEGPRSAYPAWLEEALRRQGWDAALAGPLAPLLRLSDLAPLVAFVESALEAIQGYAKPDMAILGRFLEFESAVSAVAASATAAAATRPAGPR